MNRAPGSVEALFFESLLCFCGSGVGIVRLLELRRCVNEAGVGVEDEGDIDEPGRGTDIHEIGDVRGGSAPGP